MRDTHDRARPLIVQSDGSLLVDVHSDGHESLRRDLSAFSQIVKTPEHLHTYKITPLTLWNAAAAGWTPEAVKEVLLTHSRYSVPNKVLSKVEEGMARWGKLVLESETPQGGLVRLRLRAEDQSAIDVVKRYDSLSESLSPGTAEGTWYLPAEKRGWLKQLLAKVGYPVVDCAGYIDGAPLSLSLRETTLGKRPFQMRPYQEAAVDAFLERESDSTSERAQPASKGRATQQTGCLRQPRDPERLFSSAGGGHGVVVLPCGAGKTIIAIGVIARLRMHTLVLATGATSVRQWISEILDKTDLSEDQVGEYTGQRKLVRPVTVATYQIATRPRHRALFEDRQFGLIIYDEVHLLPAPLFRTTASLQARRRLGMTATLVREDGREAEVFNLIGPKRFEMPWRALEEDGFVARANCVEVRVPPPPGLLAKLEKRQGHHAFRLAAENALKDAVVDSLLDMHEGDRVLVIGQYLSQLRRIAARLGAPLLTGEVPQDHRDVLFGDFRSGRRPVLVVSRVANFSVDLPDASVCIQVSGLFGSRQEEAQRLGRVLRPKPDGRAAVFYTLVTQDSVEQNFALARQRFLTEQGYRYCIRHWLTGDNRGSPAHPAKEAR